MINILELHTKSINDVLKIVRISRIFHSNCLTELLITADNTHCKGQICCHFKMY